MELQFTITPAHTAIRLEAALQREIAQLQGQQRRAVAHVAHWQSRWLSPLLYWLCLGAGLLAESYIAMLVWVLLFTLLWRRYAPRLLGGVSARQTGRQPPLQGLHQRLTRSMLQTALQREEGRWRLLLDAQGFTLVHARRNPLRQTRAAWADIVRLQATPDFYCLATAALAAQGKAYHLPRHSDAMDPALYQQQLALWLQRCPVALETPAMPEATVDLVQNTAQAVTPQTASSAPDR
ncbi:hypothetical protein KW830_18960 [Comamonas sp. CMM03]|uniref:hypothetical protein n=1 Tax=Comamonas sp. CMM03 TaxID=2854781 RepID=UPI001C455F13|nr:hypothetical protein [Comamonas sp. CMM03]MBV7420541.1 hypothetical protein [Comamonas sp. CMM03]